MKKLFLFLLLVTGSFAQTPKARWMLNPYDEKYFIENAGQFSEEENKLQCNILYSFSQGNTTFFLCSDELIVRECENLPETAENENDPAQRMHSSPECNYLRFNFQGSHPDLIAGRKKTGAPEKYYLPDEAGKNKMGVAATYREVFYQNIYPGIDLLFSAHEKQGLKYQYIVHPFADPKLISINFSGSTLTCENGNIHAAEGSASVIDYAPATFYADSKETIHSSYIVHENNFAFTVNDYDKSKTIVIDPWVVNPNFTDQNKAFDITCDSLGFIYVFGGHLPWKLKKFDQNGALMWTYNTAFNDWYGALAVDLHGNSYITDGCCSGTIQQIDSAGNVGWTNINGVDEYWRLAFNCDYSKLAIATAYSSSGLVPAESIALLDTATGAFSNAVTPFAPGSSEPRSLSWGLNGNLFAISCSSNEVTQLTPSFAPLFTVPSGFGLLYNGPLYSNGSNTTSGQNGISGGNNFFVTSNGSTLNKCDLASGSILSSVAIPGGFTENNSGVLVDSCEKIFAGSSNAVIQFDSSLTVVSTIPTTGEVYCLAPGKNGDLLVCGNGFIAAMALSVCRSIFCYSPTLLPTAVFSAPNHICPGTCVNFTNTSVNATSYLWTFPGANPSTSTDVSPQNICYNNPGSYDVQLVATNGAGNDTLALANYITVYPQPPPQGIIQSGDTLFAIAGATSYQWYYNGNIINGATNYFCVATQSGNYNVVATDNNGCEVEAAIFDVAATVSPLSFGDGSGVRLFPNPVGTELKIQNAEFKIGTALRISVYNVLGEKVITEWPAANSQWPVAKSPHSTEAQREGGQQLAVSLDVSQLPTGIYTIEITIADKVFRDKFVKSATK